MAKSQYYVYILTNKHRTVLYTGVTNDLARRMWEHKNQAVPGFTSRYNVDRLMYFESFRDPTDAIAREKQVKGYGRTKKVALIAKDNPDWNDLSAEWQAESVEIPRCARNDVRQVHDILSLLVTGSDLD